MKLISCYIAHFGKINEFSYDFSEGLNSILKENGWGKTTFSVFIKAMFYGMEYSPNKKKLIERNHYLPWNGSVCGGNIVFSIKEKTYRIERTFGKKDIDDTFKLFDLKTGLESSDFTENIGEELFKVDRDSFEKSVYVPQLSLATAMTDSLNAKMGNMSAAKDDINNFDKSLKAVNDKRSDYTRNSKINPGKLHAVKLELNAAKEEYEKLPALLEGYEAQERLLEEKKKQLLDLGDKKNELVDRIQLQSKKEQELGAYRIHKENLNKEKELIAELDDFFAAGIPDEDTLQKWEQAERDLAVQQTALDNMHLDETERDSVLALPFQKKIPTEEDFENWNALATKLSELRAKAEHAKLSEDATKQLEELKFFFSRMIPDEEQLAAIEKNATQITVLDGRISQANERVITLKAQASVQEKKKSSKKNPVGTIFALVFFVVFLIGGIMFHLFYNGGLGMIIEMTCFGLAVVDIGLFIVLSRNKKRSVTKENEAAEDEITSAEDELSGFINQRQALEVECSEFLSHFLLTRAETMQENVYEIRRKLDQYNHLIEEESALHKKVEGTLDELADVQLELNTQLGPFASAYGTDLFENGGELNFLNQLKLDAEKYQKYMLSEQEMAAHENMIRELNRAISKALLKYPVNPESNKAEQIHELRDKVQQYNAIVARIEGLENDIRAFEKDYNVDESVEAVNDLQNQQIQVDEMIVDLNKQILQINDNLTKSSDEIERLNELSEQIERLELKEKEYKEYAGLLADTAEYLQKARESFLAKYLKPLQNGLYKYLDLLDRSDGVLDYDTSCYEIDMDLNVVLNHEGRSRSAEYLSLGYQDMVSFCSRLALVDVLYSDEVPLLILDDPFMNLDESKIKEAINLLKTISKERQIIYFTCHDSRL